MVANDKKTRPQKKRPAPASTKSARQDIQAWWLSQAEQEGHRLALKVEEYNSADLAILGASMRELWPGASDAPESTLMELALAFYALGKVSRAFGAYQIGQLPSHETWEDAAAFVRMIQRVRQRGSWPGAAQDKPLAQDLKAWWVEQARNELTLLLPRVDEYGTIDLVIMGETLKNVWPAGRQLPPAAHIEFALANYALGKLARAYGAYQVGKLPSTDTWHDASVYIRMILRVQECGEWPGEETHARK